MSRESEPCIEVVEPGARLTIQDLGRRGSQKYGVSVSGALDAEAAILGNRLVGNPISSAVFESTYGGAELRFDIEVRAAVTGANVPVAVNGIEMPMWETLIVPVDGVLSLGNPVEGLHAYIAVAGGVATPLVLGSRSTHVATGIGGLDGGALKQGEVIPVGVESASEPRPRAGTLMPPELFPLDIGENTIRAVSGPQSDAFSKIAKDVFWGGEYQVSVQSDRQGMRLEGPRVDANDGRHDIVSDAAYMGAVQVPGDGMPIVLLADRQTTGGYTKIASVISADLAKLVQKTPGTTIKFLEVGIEEAETLFRDRRREIIESPLQSPGDSFRTTFWHRGSSHEISLARPSTSSSLSDEDGICWVSVDGEDEVAVEVSRLDDD